MSYTTARIREHVKSCISFGRGYPRHAPTLFKKIARHFSACGIAGLGRGSSQVGSHCGLGHSFRCRSNGREQMPRPLSWPPFFAQLAHANEGRLPLPKEQHCTRVLCHLLKPTSLLFVQQPHRCSVKLSFSYVVFTLAEERQQHTILAWKEVLGKTPVVLW
jgi:hypothetical protein